MTRRERLEAVIRGDINEKLIESCKEELEKLKARVDKVAENAKESERYKENRELGERICGVLGEEPLQIGEIKEKLGVEVARQRLTAICTSLAREGRIKIVDLKVKGKGTRKGYVRG